MSRPSAAKTPFDTWVRIGLQGCRVCKSNAMPHHAEGVCARCYGRVYQRRNRTRIAIYHGLWKQKQNVLRLVQTVLEAFTDRYALRYGLRLSDLKRGPLRGRHRHTIAFARSILIDRGYLRLEKQGRSEVWKLTPLGVDVACPTKGDARESI